LLFQDFGDPTHQNAPPENVRFYKAEDRYFLYFLADRPEDERAMWDAFANWLKQCQLPKFEKLSRFSRRSGRPL
jgi:hypothetical protein